MTKIKICGLSRFNDIEVVNQEKPEYIGFVFAQSRRQVTFQQAYQLRKALHKDIVPVGVFVNEKIQKIVSLVQEGIIEIIQLHGWESEEYINEIKKQVDRKIIKAVSVEHKRDIKKWENTAADYLLLDSKNGGSGECFDWNQIGQPSRPYFLAGGLCLENIKEAIKITTPYAIDISSGVETKGFKDPFKVKKLIRRIRDEK